MKNKIFILTLGISIFMLSGCQTVDEMIQESINEKNANIEKEQKEKTEKEKTEKENAETERKEKEIKIREAGDLIKDEEISNDGKIKYNRFKDASYTIDTKNETTQSWVKKLNEEEIKLLNEKFNNTEHIGNIVSVGEEINAKATYNKVVQITGNKNTKKENEYNLNLLIPEEIDAKQYFYYEGNFYEVKDKDGKELLEIFK